MKACYGIPIKAKSGKFVMYYKCSVCGDILIGENFCGECGSKIRGYLKSK